VVTGADDGVAKDRGTSQFYWARSFEDRVAWGQRFHRIRHYGLTADAERRDNLAKARELLGETPEVDAQPKGDDVPLGPVQPTFVCPHCGASMIVIDTLVRGQPIREPPQLQYAS
jgi:hypothetical protein